MSIIEETPTHPLPPGDLGTCETCVKWLLRDRKKVVQSAQGAIPLAQLIAAGQPLPKKEHILDVAPCTNSPIWGMTTVEHWCYQWRSRVVP